MGLNVDFAFSNKEIEEKFVSYLLRNPTDVYKIDSYKLLNSHTETICQSISDMNDSEIIVTIDELYENIKKKTSNISKNTLKTIYDKYTDFSNIDFLIDTINRQFFKKQIVEKAEDLILSTASANDFDIQEAIQDVNEISYLVSKINKKSKMLTTEDLAENYKKTLQERKKGIKKRSLGYSIIDNQCNRIAAPGEMTLLFGPSGMGKSAFAENIISLLVNKGIPVIKIGLEMEEEAEMDRKIAMSLNYSMDQLYDQNLDKDTGVRIDRWFSLFSRKKNYLHYDESELFISDIDSFIKEGKQYFLENAIIHSLDDYVIVFIDLASMVKDASGKYGEDIVKVADQFHNMTRRNSVHTFLIVQANENKLRSGFRFKTPEEIDEYALSEEDIRSGGGWKERCRLILSIYRPRIVKEKYFPERKDDEWAYEEDILWLHAIKNSHGKLFRLPFIFFGETFKVFPRIEEETTEVV